MLGGRYSRRVRARKEDVAGKGTRSLLVAAIVASALAGCASGGGVSGRVVTLQPSDMAKLAGTWQGTMTNVAGISWPATLTVSPNGTYTRQGGAFTSQGGRS
jgi:hypothetical protein